jgi:putative ABC transport system permease protein
MLALATRNVLRQKVRAGITAGAIAFGVAGLILSGGFVADMVAQLAEAIVHSQTGHVQVARAGFFDGRLRGVESAVIEDRRKTEAALRGDASLREVAGRLSFPALLNNGRTDAPVLAEGIEPTKERALDGNLQLLEGRRLDDADRFALMAGEGVARRLALNIGDRVDLVVATAGGAVNVLDFEVVGTFRTISREFDARAVRLPLAAAQTLLDTSGVNLLVLSLAETAAADPVRQRIDAPMRAAGLEVRAWHELNDFYPKTVALFERQFGVLQAIILLMLLLSVANTLNISVFERMGEFGTMRALGATGSKVFAAVLLEAAVLGIAGGLLGAAAGVSLAALISAVGIPMPPPPNANLGYTARIVVTPAIVGSAFGVGLAAALLGAVLPAARVSRIRIVEALRQGAC